MASPSSSTSSSSSPTSTPLSSSPPDVRTQIRGPLPLSASQEAQVRDIYYKRVRTKCADQVRDFAACASGRTFTASILCTTQRRAMNTCMLQYANQAEQDAARDEWFATIHQRKAERDAKELARKEQEKFHREWWGLDEQGNRVEKKKKKTTTTTKEEGK